MKNLVRKARINTFTNSIRNQFIFLFQMSTSIVSQVKEHMCHSYQEIKLFLQNSLKTEMKVLHSNPDQENPVYFPFLNET